MLFFKVKNDLGKSSIDDVETCTFFILVGNDYQILFTLQYLKYCIFIIKAFIYGSAAYFEIF